MKVARILDSKGGDVVTGSTEMPVSDGARLLSENGIGVLVVSDAEGGISGIFSERDIVRGLVEYGTDYLDMPLGRAMSSSVITCTPDNSVEGVMELMTANGIRHLPVVDAKTLVGVVSTIDVVRALLVRAELDREMHQMTG
jgi:CBS domain-containing protein